MDSFNPFFYFNLSLEDGFFIMVGMATNLLIVNIINKYNLRKWWKNDRNNINEDLNR